MRGRLVGSVSLLATSSILFSACSCERDASASNGQHRSRLSTTVAFTLEGPLRAAPGAACDVDGDGIDDEAERRLAESYFPYFSVDSREDCGRHGVLFRLSPHPSDPTKIAIWYVVLFERDCGLRGIGAHVGDDEVFGEVVDPSVPAPEGILALRAISHQNTTCEDVTTCGKLPRCAPCETATRNGRPYPVVYSSFRKHGGYTSSGECNSWPCDFHGCSLSASPDEPVFVNAGEPAHPLVRDLTDAGLVTQASGWTEPSLMHFDPWSGRKFGGAGDVTDDMEDTSFLVSTSGC